MDKYIQIDGWKEKIRFSSAHVIPDYEKCGRLHGHTYALHVKIWGSLDSNGIILDFSIVKNLLKNIVKKLDHKILIPENCKYANIKKNEIKIFMETLGKKYEFPKEDCILLPISSTSAEKISEYILELFIKKINIYNNIEHIELGIDEGFGQGARVIKYLKGKNK
jgi:6-pyruvoyltetrahydropterin/6-carboxytetrahydropterin synthase